MSAQIVSQKDIQVKAQIVIVDPEKNQLTVEEKILEIQDTFSAMGEVQIEKTITGFNLYVTTTYDYETRSPIQSLRNELIAILKSLGYRQNYTINIA